MRSLLIIFIALVSFGGMSAQAQEAPVTAECKFKNQEVFPDLFPQSAGAVAQCALSIGDEFSFDLYASKDLASSIGDEVAFGFSWRFDVSTIQAEVWVSRSQYRDSPGLTDLTAKLAHGAFDLTVSYYQWDKNPDGFSAAVGYTIEVAKPLSLRPSLVYTQGFGDTAVVAAGLDVRYRFDDHWAVEVTGYLPVWRDRHDDGRKPQLMFGLAYSF